VFSFQPAILTLIITLLISTVVLTRLAPGRRRGARSRLEKARFLFVLFFTLSSALRLIQYYQGGNLNPTPTVTHAFIFMFSVEYWVLCFYLLQLFSASTTMTGNTFPWLRLRIFIPILLGLWGIGYFFRDPIADRIIQLFSRMPIIYLGAYGILLWHQIRRFRSFPLVVNRHAALFSNLYFQSLILIRFLLTRREIDHNILYMLLPAHGIIFALLLLLQAFAPGGQSPRYPPAVSLADPKPFARQYDLSSREADILQELLTGKGNRQIAETLGITINTVKFHIAHIYQKCDVGNRVQLINRINTINE